MKVVINKCFGGFSISKAAVRRMAELQGRPCYFFTNRGPDGALDFNKHFPDTSDDNSLFWSAFDVPNPDEVLSYPKPWHEMTMAEKDETNRLHDAHVLTSRPDNRSDPLLIQVVEELGGGHRTGASGACAELRIVEVPDGIEYTIEEYDGNEHIAEVHQTWG